uniref:hypothetical protein n=1 Tax=Herbidospora sakaeratensis TaxID=564415 RepID=UPI000A5C0FF6|nr:hypothetical protein [Herbidospora sakaeratensis]
MRWSKGPAKRVIGVPGNGIRLVACTELDGHPTFVSLGKDNGVLHLHDVSGRLVRELRLPAAGEITAFACGLFDGRRVAAIGRRNHTVALVDLATGTVLSDNHDAHAHPLSGLAVADVDGESVVVSADDQSVVAAWNAVDAEPADGLPGVAAVRGCYGTPAADDWVTRVMSIPTSASPPGSAIEGRITRPVVLDVKRSGGRHVIASACGIRVHAHDLRTGAKTLRHTSPNRCGGRGRRIGRSWR